MAIQLSVAARNARLDAIETTIGTTPKLRMYSGAMPANCAAARTGTLLVDVALASDWMANAASGAKAANNLPIATTGQAGAGAGTNVGYFCITDAAGTTVGLQGTVTATGGGGDMTVDNISIASGQAVNVTGFTLTDGNA